MSESLFSFSENPSGITDVPGFLAASTAADIRQTGDHQRLDMALIFSESSATTAAVFTKNDVKAAPVLLSIEYLESTASAQGCLINSGNANAATGATGRDNAWKLSHRTSQKLNVPAECIHVASTGRIGRQLPVHNMITRLESLTHSLSSDREAGLSAADAILTSDTCRKVATVTGPGFTIGAMAKGAGMIEPNMATMLAYLATDVTIQPELLQRLLKAAVDQSFNCITVDGDMSTNDTVMIFANGSSGTEIPDDPSNSTYQAFSSALNAICFKLAHMIVSDGEKISKVITIKVKGAPDKAAADKVARCIGNSLLVKSSWYGEDPNWGRLIDAAGYAQIGLDSDNIDLFYDSFPALLKGEPQDAHATHWKDTVQQKEFTVTLDLHLGAAEAKLLATDLTEAYVNFNRSE